MQEYEQKYLKNISEKENRKYLCGLLSRLVKKYREDNNKSISLISNEVELSKSTWADLEKGSKDPQFTTLWRMSEALGIKMSELMMHIEKELPENWHLTDE